MCDRCVCCGEIIPEGRQVCPKCEKMANEKRLIDAHDLWTDIMMLPHNGDMISSEEVEQAIKDAPTVDAVEVVRCKDCKHCIYHSYACGDVRCGMLHTDYITENSFCSYGERKDNA